VQKPATQAASRKGRLAKRLHPVPAGCGFVVFPCVLPDAARQFCPHGEELRETSLKRKQESNMSQQNVNFTASESKESSLYKGQGDLSQAGEVLGEGFFAPVESDLVDSLLGRYQHTRAIIGEIAGAVTNHENAPAVAHFISGNLSGRRGGYGFSVGEVFNVTGAVASLNAAYWQEALNLTDVYEYMPNDRRNEWNEQIREMKAPDFEEATVFNKATDDEKKRIPRNRNLTWDTFTKLNQFFSNDRALKEFIMSMVGTVIYDANGNPTFLQPRGGSESMFNTLLNGGTEKIYRCNDNTTCLSPTIADLTLSEDEGMTGRVRDMLNDIFDKARSDTAMTENEKALINSTRVRILRYTIDSASVGMDQSVVSSLAEYIAADMVMSYINGLIDVAASGAAGTLDTEEENKHFRENLRQVRNELSARVQRIQVQQNGLAEYDRSLSETRQQLSSSVSDSVLSNYQFGG
jgi:hypothetical protein